MAKASKTVEVNVPIQKFWDVIVDYEKYSEFVDGVSSVKVHSKSKIEYRIELLGKDIHYTLEHHESAPNHMHWKMIDSNIFKSNDGSWELKDLGNGKTEVTYSLELEFKIYVPGMVLNGLVKSTLPKMISQFEERTKNL